MNKEHLSSFPRLLLEPLMYRHHNSSLHFYSNIITNSSFFSVDVSTRMY